MIDKLKQDKYIKSIFKTDNYIDRNVNETIEKFIEEKEKTINRKSIKIGLNTFSMLAVVACFIIVAFVSVNIRANMLGKPNVISTIQALLKKIEKQPIEEKNEEKMEEPQVNETVINETIETNKNEAVNTVILPSNTKNKDNNSVRNETSEAKKQVTNNDNSFYNTKENKANTYTVTFNSDGGTDIKTQYVESNKKATRPNVPNKEGYSFVEWQLDGKTFDFNKSINENITLIAVWDKIYHPIIDTNVDINDFKYINGQYIYNTRCDFWSTNATLEISKNSKGNVIKEQHITSEDHIIVDLPVSRGETAKFYFRMYVTKNGFKEYSEYRTLSVTAPIEEYDKLHLNEPSVEAILLDGEGNRVYTKNQAKVLRLNLSSSDTIKGYMISNGNGMGIYINNVSTYDFNPTVAYPDFYEAYFNGKLYIKSYIQLSNGAYFHSSNKLIHNI